MNGQDAIAIERLGLFVLLLSLSLCGLGCEEMETTSDEVEAIDALADMHEVVTVNNALDVPVVVSRTMFDFDADYEPMTIPLTEVQNKVPPHRSVTVLVWFEDNHTDTTITVSTETYSKVYTVSIRSPILTITHDNFK